MHDIHNLDQRGLPGLFVASSEFVAAAEAQGQALGYTPRVVFVPHPIQDRSDEEMQRLADDALAAILDQRGAG